MIVEQAFDVHFRSTDFDDVQTLRETSSAFESAVELSRAAAIQGSIEQEISL